MPQFSCRAPFLSCAALMLAVAPAVAGVPPSIDCDGISPVFASNPEMTGDLTTVRIASGFASPVLVTYAPGDDERVFVVEQNGLIKVVKNGVLLATPFIDLSGISACCGERGVLGLAFHPDYLANRFFFVYYTANDGAVTISRYQRNAGNPDIADPGSATIVKSIPHPIGNHNGGTVAFSPLDGHLYFAVGDGGSACDPGAAPGNAQTLTSDLGKLHRLNVNTLPATTTGNPFDGAIAGNDSIWSYGLRNPFRINFDRETGNVFIGDVGQGTREEISCGNASGFGGGGENYGWVNLEGNVCNSCGEGGGCSPTAYRPPIHEYVYFGGASVISGSVYRGCRMPALQGTYFYSDYTADFIRTLRLPATQSCPGPIAAFINRTVDLDPDPPQTAIITNIASFGENNRGEIYIADHSGELFKILPNLNIMEVSGPNAEPLLMSASSWSWEHLGNTVEHTFSQYKIYRSVDGPQGEFNCLGRISANSCAETCTWAGDPTDPAPDEVFYYLITATGTGPVAESTAGAASDGTLRVVNTASSCT